MLCSGHSFRQCRGGQWIHIGGRTRFAPIGWRGPWRFAAAPRQVGRGALAMPGATISRQASARRRHTFASPRSHAGRGSVACADSPSTVSVGIERKIELVISRMSEPVVDNQLVVENLFDDSHAVVAGAQNPWTRRRKIALAELVNEPWTLLPFDIPAGALIAEAFRSSGLEPPRATVFTQSINVRTRLLATGRFLTTFSRLSLDLPGRNPALKALPVEIPNMRRPIGIITLKNRTLSPLAELFIKTTRAVAKPLAKAR